LPEFATFYLSGGSHDKAKKQLCFPLKIQAGIIVYQDVSVERFFAVLILLPAKILTIAASVKNKRTGIYLGIYLLTFLPEFATVYLSGGSHDQAKKQFCFIRRYKLVSLCIKMRSQSFFVRF
jgi:hypothetical protein